MACYYLISESDTPIFYSWEGKLLQDITSYMLHLTNTSAASTTIANQASHLKCWYKFLADKKIGLYDASDKSLKDFEDAFIGNKGMERASINAYLMTVYAFYWFAEGNGLCRRVIGFKEFGSSMSPQITVHRAEEGSFREFKVPYLKRPPKQLKRYTPTPQEVSELYDKVTEKIEEDSEVLKEERITQRHLELDWLAEVGLRRQEVSELRITDLPPLPDSKGVYWTQMRIVNGSKGGKKREIDVPVELIRKTLDFIRFERETIVEEILDGSDPPTVFVSTRRGTSGITTASAITNFLKGISDKISPHALRRYALTNFAAYLFALERAKEIANRPIDRKYIELKLMQQAGHGSINTTIQSYVDVASVINLTQESMEPCKESIRLMERATQMMKDLYAQDQVRNRIGSRII